MSGSVGYINIDFSQAGQKLMAFLGRNLRACSGVPLPPSLLYRLVRSGQIRVNKGRVKPGYVLQAGDSLRIPPLERVSLPIQPEAGLKASVEAEAGSGYSADAPARASACVETGPEAGMERGEVETRTAGMLESRMGNAPKIGPRLKLKCPELGVIAETDSLLALNKPSGLPVHGGSKQSRSVISLLLECVGQSFGQNSGQNSDQAAGQAAGFTPTLAHRLDKNTSGVLLVAKTYAFLRLVQDSLRQTDPQQRARKYYLAWVKGVWPQAGRGGSLVGSSTGSGLASLAASSRIGSPTGSYSGVVELEDRLVKKADAKGAEKVNISGNGEGSVCKSRVEALARRPDATLLRVELLTGRTHQIRVQLASRGFPIIGDLKYGGPPLPPEAGRGMLLHSYIFSLPGAGLEFTALPPWGGGFAPEQNYLSGNKP